MHSDDQARRLGLLETVLSLPPEARLTALRGLAGEAAAVLGKDDPVAFEIEFHLVGERSKTGPIEGVVEAWRELHERMLAALGPDDRLVPRTRSAYVRRLRDRDHPGDADVCVELNREILAAQERLGGTNAYLTAMARTNLAVALRHRGGDGDLAEARRIAEEEAGHRAEAYEHDNAFSWIPWGILADVMLDQCEAHPDPVRAERARELAQRVADRRMERFGREAPLTIIARRRLGRALLLTGSHREAAELLDKLRIIERTSEIDEDGSTEELLGRALAAFDPPRARESAEAALTLFLARYGPLSRTVVRARETLTRLSAG